MRFSTDWFLTPPVGEILGLILLAVAVGCVALSSAGYGWAATVLVVGYRLVVLLLGLAALWLLVGFIIRRGRHPD